MWISSRFRVTFSVSVCVFVLVIYISRFTCICTWVVSKKPPPKNSRISLLHKVNISHVYITIDQYLQQCDPRTRVAFSSCEGRTSSPFAIRLYLRHSEIGIDFPQTFRVPHTQRISWLTLVHQPLPPDNFFIWPPCKLHLITKIRLCYIIQHIWLLNVST